MTCAAIWKASTHATEIGIMADVREIEQAIDDDTAAVLWQNVTTARALYEMFPEKKHLAELIVLHIQAFEAYWMGERVIH